MAGWYDDDAPNSPWSVSLFVDDRADATQYAALVDIFLGRAGGGTLENFAAALAPAGPDQQPDVRDDERHEVCDCALGPRRPGRPAPKHDVELVDGEQDSADDGGSEHGPAQVLASCDEEERLASSRPLREVMH